MLIKKRNRIKSENTKNSTAYVYPFGDTKIDLAFIEVNGRYPEAGSVTNRVVRETVFVVKGNGRVVIDDVEHLLEDNDALLILPNQKYFFDGRFKLVVSCSPAWYSKQHVES